MSTITNKGKTIINKFLLGQTTSYASHIAIGCGALPVSANSFSVNNKALSGGTVTLTTSSAHTFAVGDYVSVSGVGYGFDGIYQTISGTTASTVKYSITDTTTTVSSTAVSPTGFVAKDHSNRTALDFEMLRVPIISRGYIYEDGIDKLVLTAELPSDERYEITEIATFSAGSNNAVLNDSKHLFLFSTNENWENHVSTTSSALPTLTTDLGSTSTGSIAPPNAGIGFFAYADNGVLDFTARLQKQERPRFGNVGLFIPGDMSGTITTGTSYTYTSGASHIHLTNVGLDLDKNSSTDELVLAFSVLGKDTTTPAPTNVTVLVEFSSAHDVSGAGVVYAQFQYTGTVTDANRYVVARQQLGNIYKSSGFTWSQVSVAKVFVSVDNSSSYYVALDGLRLENKYSGNPLYGMTAYSIVNNLYTDSSYTQYAKPIIKNANTTGQVEFRFSVGVG